MHKTTLQEFATALTTTGSYLTPAERCPGRRVKPGFWTTLRLAWSVIRVFPITSLTYFFRLLTVSRWYRICMGTVTIPERLGLSVAFTGFEKRLAHKGPVIYVANHMSAYETMALPPALGACGPLKIIVKASLSHLPGLEGAARMLGLIPIGRKDPRADLVAMTRAVGAALKEGYSVLLFPQGTRMPVFAHARYSSLGAKLAEKNGVPLVPIALDSRCLPTNDGAKKGGLLHDFGLADPSRDIRVACGPIIPPAPAREMHEASFDWIASQLEAWGVPTDRTTSIPTNK